MAVSVTDIYTSSNGDRWRLIRDSGSGIAFVRHEPNPSSGGRTADIDVNDFLNADGSGPEYAALRRLLESSTDPTDSAQK